MPEYNKEDKITIEELAPSVRTLFIEINEKINQINAKMSDEATESNKVLSEHEIDMKIDGTSAYPIYKDASQSNFNTRAELSSATVFYNAKGEVRVPTDNDYTYVIKDETHNNHLTRYVYSRNTWAFEIEVDLSGKADKTELQAEITARTNADSEIYQNIETVKTELEAEIALKVDSSNTASILYGTDENGQQKLYDLTDFGGQVSDVQVNGESVVEDKVAKVDLSDYYNKQQARYTFVQAIIADDEPELQHQGD